MSLRDELLEDNHNDPLEAACHLALRLTRGNLDSLKAGYSKANAVLATRDIFPEITEHQIRVNLWPETETTQ